MKDFFVFVLMLSSVVGIIALNFAVYAGLIWFADHMFKWVLYS